MLGGAPDGSPLRFALRAQLRDDPSRSPQSSQPKCQRPPGVQATFEQPVRVVVAAELTDARAPLLEGVEALDPQHLFLERLDEFLDDAVGFGLVEERR